MNAKTKEYYYAISNSGNVIAGPCLTKKTAGYEAGEVGLEEDIQLIKSSDLIKFKLKEEDLAVSLYDRLFRW